VGLIVLPAWCRKLPSAIIALLAAVCLSYLLPLAGSSPMLHEFGSLLLHPLWGGLFFSFSTPSTGSRIGKPFAIANRFNNINESAGVALHRVARLRRHLFLFVVPDASTRHHGILSVLCFRLPATLTPLIITTPACIAFAWVFFRFCERPFLSSRAAKTITASIETSEAKDKIESHASASSA
jgi:hypothetical protein